MKYCINFTPKQNIKVCKNSKLNKQQFLLNVYKTEENKLAIEKWTIKDECTFIALSRVYAISFPVTPERLEIGDNMHTQTHTNTHTCTQQ